MSRRNKGNKRNGGLLSCVPMVASGKAERSGAEKEALISYFLWHKERSIVLLLSLTQRKKQRNIRPTKASPQGEDATDYGGKPPCVRVFGMAHKACAPTG